MHAIASIGHRYLELAAPELAADILLHFPVCSEVLHGKDLSGQTAVVTGARNGIGLEITRVLARAGCRVIMAVRKQAAGELEARKLRSSPTHCDPS